MCSLPECLFPTHLGRHCPTTSLAKALEVTGAVTGGGRAGSCCIWPFSPEILGSLREPAQKCHPAHCHCCILPLEASKGSPAPASPDPEGGEGAGYPSQSPGPSKQKSSSPTSAHLRCDFSCRQAEAVPSPRGTGV